METEKNSRMLELFFRVLRGETISVKAVAGGILYLVLISIFVMTLSCALGGTPRPDAAGGTGVFL